MSRDKSNHCYNHLTEGKLPSVLMIMLCMRCGLGGAEKRYARVFEMLVAQPGARHRLLINLSMLNLLQVAGILLQHEPYLIVLEPPFRRYTQSRGAHWSLSFLQPVMWLLDALWYAWQCWQVIRRYKPKVVHPLLTARYLCFPALFLQPKAIHVMSAYAARLKLERGGNLLGGKLVVIIQRYVMSRRSQVIDALSWDIRDELVALGIDDKKIQVAPCSFSDFSLCQPAPQKKKWVVFLARFVEMKNPLLLARAIPEILARDSDVHFYFLGRGPLQPQIEALIQKSNVADHVTLRFEPNPIRILNQSTIFTSLQVDENYPSQSLLEAMACGNAIVATDVGETWRLVDEANGVRVPPTVDAVAEAIISLLKNPKLPQLGHASRQRALTEHTPERFFDYITNVYRTAATGPPT